VKASLIIAFYKKIEYLRLVLAGVKIQTEKSFEVVLADDGTEPEMFDEIQSLLKQLSVPAVHIWQEDKGFRKNRVLNKAVKNSSGEYLIFIDGDCVPHSHFVEEHLRYAEKGTVLTGRRVNLSERITKRLTPEKIENHYLEKNPLMLIADGVFGKTTDVEKGFYFRSKFLRKFINRKKRGLLGCNFSLYKEDLLEINGFDERYESPSIGEDSDVQFRLELKGTKIKSLNNIAIQYHLYHKPLSRTQRNILLFEKIKTEKKAKTNFGIRIKY